MLSASSGGRPHASPPVGRGTDPAPISQDSPTAALASAVDGHPPGVIVAGMHRSGTSLVASILLASGWRASGTMLGADQGNARGYFEDRQVHDLHRRLLESYDTAWDLGPRLRQLRDQPLSLSPREQTVTEIVTTFRADGPWVWKNPRATLFLQAWAERFPEARVVICVRAPSAVVDSMWRRGNRLRMNANRKFYRVRRAARALSVWHSYNLIAYRFARSHPDRVVVVRIPKDLERLAAATNPPLYDQTMMKSGARPSLRLFSALAVRSQLLYWRLCRLHDPQRLDDVLAGPDGRPYGVGAATVHRRRQS